MDNHELLKQGIAAARSGDKVRARALMARLVQADPNSEPGWLILGHSLSDPEKQEYCFQKVLQINPSNQVASRMLAELRTLKSGREIPVDQISLRDDANENLISRAKRFVRSSLAKIGNWGSAAVGFVFGSIVVGIPLLLIFRSFESPAFFDRAALNIAGRPASDVDLQGAQAETPASTMTAGLTATPSLTPLPTPAADFNTRFKDAYGNVLQAERYMENRDYVQAVLTWDSVIESVPEYAEAYYQRGLAHYGLTANQRIEEEFLLNLQQSYNDFSQAIELHPANGDYYAERASLSNTIAGAEDFEIYRYPWYEQSFRDSLKAIELGSSFEFGNRMPGFNLLSLGRCEEALDFFMELEQTLAPEAPASAGINTGLAQAYLCLGQYQKALEHIDLAIEISISAPRVWTRLHILYNLGRFGQIVQELTESIDQTVVYGGARYYFRAAAYYELGATDLALQDLETGSRNTWLKYWFNAYVLGQVALDEGDTETALYWLQLAEASISPEGFPDFHQKLQTQIQSLDGELLFTEESVPSVFPTVAFENIPVVPDFAQATPTPSLHVASAGLANYLGTGIIYLRGGDFPVFLFRPSGRDQLFDVLSLVIRIEGGQPGEESTLQASYLSSDGGWGGFDTLVWGENEVGFPQRYVDSRGYIYIAVRNFGAAPQLITNMSIRLVAVDQDGVEQVYGFRE